METLPGILNAAQQEVGAEAFNIAALNHIAESFSRVYNGQLFKDISRHLQGMFSSNLAYSKLPPVRNQLKTWLESERFLVLADIQVFVPKGLCVPYNQYVSELEAISAFILRVDTDMIKPTMAYIGVLINNPEFSKSASSLAFKDANSSLLNVDTEKLMVPMTKCFDSKNVTDTTRYADAFQNNGDVTAIIKRVQTLEDNLSRTDPTMVRKSAEQLFVSAEHLADAIRNDSNYAQLSKTVSKDVSARLYACALWIELYAVYVRQIMVINVALADTVKKLEKVSAKK